MWETIIDLQCFCAVPFNQIKTIFSIIWEFLQLVKLNLLSCFSFSILNRSAKFMLFLLQLDGGGVASGGLRELIPCIARTAVAVGVDGIFMEV